MSNPILGHLHAAINGEPLGVSVLKPPDQPLGALGAPRDKHRRRTRDLPDFYGLSVVVRCGSNKDEVSSLDSPVEAPVVRAGVCHCLVFSSIFPGRHPSGGSLRARQAFFLRAFMRFFEKGMPIVPTKRL